MSNSGHGHVSPRDDGIKARCGGPALCRECAKDLALKTQQEKLMTSTDKERADFKEWRTELLDLIFHYATGAMLNGKTELKRHLARIERQIDAVPRAGREAERAEAVTDAEAIRAALEAAHKLLQPRLDEPDRTVFWLIVDALHDLKCCKTHPPKTEPSQGVEARRVRHKKRGTTYEVVGRAQVQVSDGDGLTDYELAVVYRSLNDGSLWVRRVSEFEDGRFEDLPALTKPEGK